MPLILQPTFSNKSREEIEQHLLAVRARRMAAVVTYYAGVNAKNLHLVAREQQRVAREYEMLKREIDKMNKLEEAIEKRLITLEEHQQMLDMHRGNLVEIEDGGADKQQKQKANGKLATPQRTGVVRSGRPPGA